MDITALARRLRDLSLLDVEALVRGAKEPKLLLEAAAYDLRNALQTTREVLSGLHERARQGPSSFRILDVEDRLRMSDDGADASERMGQMLEQRSGIYSDIARLQSLASLVVPRLVEIERYSAQK